MRVVEYTDAPGEFLPGGRWSTLIAELEKQGAENFTGKEKPTTDGPAYAFFHSVRPVFFGEAKVVTIVARLK